MRITMNTVVVNLVQGDITEMEVDAIVNAANSHLQHGGGVAGAISRKGGPLIQKESDEWIKSHGVVQTGSAAITSAGQLKSRYIIHAVGPRYGSGNEEEKLRSATKAALDLAVEYNLKSLAFPAIGAGIFGIPVEMCAKNMLAAVRDYAEKKTILEELYFCLWGQSVFETFSEILTTLKNKGK